MTVSEQRDHIINFFRTAAARCFDECISIIVLKGEDYAPERIAMTEVFFTAADISSTVPQILHVHVKKHMSAIATYMQAGALRSEDLRSRLQDVANYMALIDSYVANPVEWLRHLDRLLALSEFPNRSQYELTRLHEWMHNQMVIHGALPSDPLPLDR